MRISKLSTRLLVASVTFTIGVAVTMLWVVPRFSTEQTPTIPVVSIPPNKQDPLLRKGWKRIDFYRTATLMLPADMKEAEVFKDRYRHTKDFENEELQIEISGYVWDPTIRDKMRHDKFHLCDRPDVLTKNPTYKESPIQIDGRQARLGITREKEFGGIGAAVCFPVPDDPGYEFMVAASCKDDQALAIAMEIFNSITFRK